MEGAFKDRNERTTFENSHQELKAECENRWSSREKSIEEEKCEEQV